MILRDLVFDVRPQDKACLILHIVLLFFDGFTIQKVVFIEFTYNLNPI